MRSLALSALVLTVVLAACSHADLLSPNPPTAATYDGVYVSPASAELSTAAPSNTVALAAFPTNNDGKRLYVSNPVVSYSSSATGIATVSGDGIVTAVAPGEAVIAVALTIDGVTHTGDSTIHVYPPGSWPALGGVHALTGSITWANDGSHTPNDSTELTTITIQHNGDMPAFTGTFANFRVVAPRQPDPGIGFSGTVSGTVHTDGSVILKLSTSGSPNFWEGQGALTAQGMAGSYADTYTMAGTFVTLRQ